MYTIEDYQSRHSVRCYDPTPVASDILKKLQAKITDINTHGLGMHLRMITSHPDPFRGFTRSYGMFKGVRNYIACIADTSYGNLDQRLGFHIMDVVMKAHSLGLGTCIVGATFDKNSIDARIKIGEVMPIVITFGYPATKGEKGISLIARKLIHRKPIEPWQMLDKGCRYQDCPDSIKTALQAIALAPSAYNAHPARLRYKPDEPATMVKCKTGKFVDIDMGIAMFCYSDICGAEWEWGNPATATTPDHLP